MGTLTTTTCPDVASLQAHLLEAGVKGPSLHPDVDSPSAWSRWNGWNEAVSIGVDAAGQFVRAEVWEFASGYRDWEANGGLGLWALERLAFPLEMVPAIPNVRHPEHTPA